MFAPTIRKSHDYLSTKTKAIFSLPIQNNNFRPINFAHNLIIPLNQPSLASRSLAMPPHASLDLFDDDTACHRKQEDICWSRVSKQSHAKSTPPLTRSVSFKNVVRAKKILHIDDYSDDDIERCWYTHDDFANMRYIARTDAQVLEKGKRLNPNQCTEGLRIYTPSGRNIRRRNVRRAISIVLEEQMLQMEEGSNDPEFIAQLYAEVSASARKEALIPSSPNRRNKHTFFKRVSLGL